MIELERPQRWLQPPWGMSEDGDFTMSNSKTCTKCGQILPMDSFGKDKKTKDGLRLVCKSCNNASALSYYYSNKEEVSRKAAARFILNMQIKPDVIRSKAAKRQSTYRKNNPEKVKASQFRYSLQNPGAHYASTKKWRALNPHKVIEANMRRRALRMSAVTYLVTDKDIQRIMNKPCAYCGKKSEHLDHVIALNRGGSHGVGNLIGACASCNTSKNDKFIMEWRKKCL